MKEKGLAHIGIGTGKGENKALDAVKMAVESPLLETKITGATDVIINVSGDITLTDASEASNYVQDLAGDDVNIIFGAMYDDNMTDSCDITVIATGIEEKSAAARVAQQMTQQQVQTAQTMARPTGAVGMNNLNAQTVRPATTAQAPINPMQRQAVQAQPMQSVEPIVGVQKPQVGLNRPTEVRSTVEPKSLKIPDFLQRK